MNFKQYVNDEDDDELEKKKINLSGGRSLQSEPIILNKNKKYRYKLTDTGRNIIVLYELQ